jgi:hypothetical protein
MHVPSGKCRDKPENIWTPQEYLRGVEDLLRLLDRIRKGKTFHLYETQSSIYKEITMNLSCARSMAL